MNKSLIANVTVFVSLLKPIEFVSAFSSYRWRIQWILNGVYHRVINVATRWCWVKSANEHRQPPWEFETNTLKIPSQLDYWTRGNVGRRRRTSPISRRPPQGTLCLFKHLLHEAQAGFSPSHQHFRSESKVVTISAIHIFLLPILKKFHMKKCMHSTI